MNKEKNEKNRIVEEDEQGDLCEEEVELAWVVDLPAVPLCPFYRV